MAWTNVDWLSFGFFGILPKAISRETQTIYIYIYIYREREREREREKETWYNLNLNVRRLGSFLSYLRKEFNYLRRINVPMCRNDTKYKYMFMFHLKNLAHKGLRIINLRLQSELPRANELIYTQNLCVLSQHTGPAPTSALLIQ